MKLTRIITCLLLIGLPILLTDVACAASLPYPLTIAAGIGYSHYPSSNNQTFAISNYITDTLHQASNNNSPSFNLSVSVLKHLAQNAWLSQLAFGPSFYYQHHQQNGDVFELNNPQFDNYSYRLRSNNFIALMSADFYLNPLYHGILPFISAGVGASFARVTYDDYAKPGIASDSELHLNGHTSTHFAAAIGAGLLLPLATHVAATIRYEYLDPGQASSGQTPAFQLQKGVPINLRSHNLFLTINYLL